MTATTRLRTSVPARSPAGSLVRAISRDADLLRWVEASAVGTGASVQTCDEPRSVAREWRRPALLLLGADVAPELAAAGPPRHPQLHLLARPDATAESLRAGLRLGARSVIDPTRDASALAALVAAVGDPRPPGRVVAVGAGSGGAGASTLAAALALTAARTGPTALVVCDPQGPEPALLLGSEPASGLTWLDLAASEGRIGPVALREALPLHHGVSLLGPGASLHPPGVGTLRRVLDAARSGFDTVVVDGDPRSGAVWDEVVSRADRTWIVARPHVAALSAARSRLGEAGPTVRVAVRGDGVATSVAARALGMEVVVRIGDERRLDEWTDLGAGPLTRRRGPIAWAARAVLDDLVSPGGAA